MTRISIPLLPVIIVLGIGLFCFDLYLPRGLGNGVLYGGLVILSFLLPNRKAPVITAAICTVLDLGGIMRVSAIPILLPLWMLVINRVLSLTAIWLPLLFFLHRRRAEEALQKAHDELEERVEARTHQLAALNQSLIKEIVERNETEQSLRLSESMLQARERQLQQNQEDLRALAGQLLTAQEEDRRRISRDLHDDINQRLAMLAMDIRQMEKGPCTDPAHLLKEMHRVSERLTAVSDDIRRMAYRFHPSILDDLGLVKALRRLVDDFSPQTGIKCSYVYNEPASPLPAEVTICIFRVVQESLSNIARHAQASCVEVELICEDETVDLSIFDNGVGFDVKQSTMPNGHLGLLSMKERVRLAKGTLELTSTPRRGTRIRMIIPLPPGGGCHA